MAYYLLYFSIIYLLLNSLIMWLNWRDFKPLLSPGEQDPNSDIPLVSICIPARNEENVIRRAVESVLKQQYPNFELLVLDDKSTDQTVNILGEIKENNPENLLIIKGKPKPDNWLGKSWACYQLSKQAKGEILVFIDADVWLKPDFIRRAVASLHHFDDDFITVWPYQKLGTFWEKAVIPIIYYGLLTLLPVRYVHSNFGWLPASISKRISPSFAAACGQCMIFKRSVYHKIGGHKSVKNNIVEDVALAKQIKRNGFSMRMFYGGDSLSCRMYTSAREMWQGFRKNFLALYNNSVPTFIFMALINMIVYILPAITFIVSIFSGNGLLFILSFCALALMFSQRTILSRWYHWPVSISFLHPLGVLWFHILGIQVIKDHFAGKRARWKNRPTS